MVPGDHARFIGDITVPDCSPVKRGSTFVKTWRFEDVGSVAWRDYSLRRIDDLLRPFPLRGRHRRRRLPDRAAGHIQLIVD